MLYCEADQLLRLTPVVQTITPKLLQDSDKDAGSSSAINDVDMKHVIKQSNQLVDNDDESLQKVLAMSELSCKQ